MTSLPYTPLEESLHAGIHATGFLAGLLAIPWLLMVAVEGADLWRVAGAVVFSVSAMLVFATSTCYHRATNAVAP